MTFFTFLPGLMGAAWQETALLGGSLFWVSLPPPGGPGPSSLFSGLHLASSFSLSHLCCCSFLSTSSGPSYTPPFRQDVNTIYLLASGDLQPQEPHEVLPAPRARLSSLPWFFQLSFCQLLLLSCSCRILSWASCLLTLAFPVSGAFPVSWLMMLGRERVPVWVCVHMRVCVCAHVCSRLLFSLPNLIPPPPHALFPLTHPCCNHFMLLWSISEDRVISLGGMGLGVWVVFLSCPGLGASPRAAPANPLRRI